MLLPAFNKIAKAFDEVQKPEDVGFKSRILNQIIFSLPKLKVPVKDILDAVCMKKAAEGKKDQMWNDTHKYPAISDRDLVGHVFLL